MKLIWGIILLCAIACTTNPKKPDQDGPIDIPDLPDIDAPKAWASLPPEVPFQIMHIDDLDDLKDQLKSDTKVAVLEISQAGKAETDYLRSKGIISIGYSSTTAEDWRDEYKLIPSHVKGKVLDGWDEEEWTDIRSEDWLQWYETHKIIPAKEKGFDALEPDNVDHGEQDKGDRNRTGFNISKEENITALRVLSQKVHSHGLAICLKNSPFISEYLVDYFDCVMSESCQKYNECDDHDGFKHEGKGLYGVEYVKRNCKKVPGWTMQYKRDDEYFNNDYEVCDELD